MVGRMGCRGSVGCAAGLGLTVGGRGKAREFFEIFPEVRLAAERQDVGYLPYGIRTGAEQTPGMENGESLYPFAGRCPGGHGYHPAEMLPADGEFVGSRQSSLTRERNSEEISSYLDFAPADGDGWR